MPPAAAQHRFLQNQNAFILGRAIAIMKFGFWKMVLQLMTTYLLISQPDLEKSPVNPFLILLNVMCVFIEFFLWGFMFRYDLEDILDIVFHGFSIQLLLSSSIAAVAVLETIYYHNWSDNIHIAHFCYKFIKISIALTCVGINVFYASLAKKSTSRNFRSAMNVFAGYIHNTESDEEFENALNVPSNSKDL